MLKWVGSFKKRVENTSCGWPFRWRGDALSIIAAVDSSAFAKPKGSFVISVSISP
jgi:hypothetical protein